MVERWKVQGSGRWIHGLEVTPLIRQRIQRGIFETRFVSDHNRILSFLADGDDIRLTLMNSEESPSSVADSATADSFSMEGLHALIGTPASAPADTMSLDDALAAASALVTDGDWPEGAVPSN